MLFHEQQPHNDASGAGNHRDKTCYLADRILRNTLRGHVRDGEEGYVRIKQNGGLFYGADQPHCANMK